MIYILFGVQDSMIKNRIKKIIRDDFEGKADVVKLSMDEVTLGNLVDEFDQFSITGEPKLIICENCYFIESSTRIKNKLFNKDEYEELCDEIGANLNSNSIIFTVNGAKIDNSSAIVKHAKKNGKIREFKDVEKNDWPLYVKEYFNRRNIKISDDAIAELVKRVDGDLNKFSNEAAKLILHNGGHDVTLDDVTELVSNALEDDVFNILNSLILGDKTKALATYRDLKLLSTEPITLINLMTSSIIFMLNVYNLSQLGYKNDDIAKKLNTSSGRIYMTFKNLRNISINKLNDALEDLYLLDKKIKHSEIDRFIGFELFLTEF